MRLAIDPGASGGIASEEDSGGIRTWPMPANADMLCVLARIAGGLSETKVAYLEALVKHTGWAMPASAMAVYAANWGRCEGILTALGYKIVIVQPKRWQKEVGLSRAKKESKTAWKNRLKVEAKNRFPNADVTLKTADALLILAAAQTGKLDED